MSTTSSQYYRSADTHSHYPNFPANNHEHVYALAASWHQDPNHASYVGPPSATFLHYPHGGADSVAQPSSAHQAWSTSYARPELQGWEQSGGDHVYASRPAVPFDAAEGSASVPQSTAQASRQYQQEQTLHQRSQIPLSPIGDGYRNTDNYQVTSVRELHTL
jgi:hypothetical protein